MSESFEEWLKENAKYEECTDIEDVVGAWNHQQKKIDELEDKYNKESDYFNIKGVRYYPMDLSLKERIKELEGKVKGLNRAVKFWQLCADINADKIELLTKCTKGGACNSSGYVKDCQGCENKEVLENMESEG